MDYVQYINEIKNSKVIVLYPGRFQPFHKGHYYSYTKLKESFPENEIYIITSDVEKDDTHPFSFDEKKYIMTTMFEELQDDYIIENRKPYDVKSILKKMGIKPYNVIVIVAIGEKDYDERFKNDDYFIEFDGMLEYTANSHVYKYKLPQLQLQIGSEIVSGNLIRSIFKKQDEPKKKRMFITVYPEWNSKIYKFINNRINQPTN